MRNYEVDRGLNERFVGCESSEMMCPDLTAYLRIINLKSFIRPENMTRK
jgi:hypothetical protein